MCVFPFFDRRLKRKTRDCLGNRGFWKILGFLSHQDFVPTTPTRRKQRCPMALEPLTGACILICLVNVVLISNALKIVNSGGLSKNFPACRLGGAC
jgi:hypothetical protein